MQRSTAASGDRTKLEKRLQIKAKSQIATFGLRPLAQ
jgi:hypothetical protein